MRTTRIVELDLAKPQPATRGLYTTSIAFAATIWRVMRNRWASNRLHELDDRQLDDIGLSRHDVFAATHASRLFDDPAALLAESARRRAVVRFERLRRI
ncbi:DUF1127 domain-containing protein [Pseudorhizobium sp. NPDC055634]